VDGMKWTIGLLLVVGLVACGAPTAEAPPDSPDDETIEVDAFELANGQSLQFPRQAPVEGGREVMQAQLIGRLVHEGACLRVEDAFSETSTLTIWPPGYGVAEEGDQLFVTDESGRALAHVGQEITIDGGDVPVGGQDAFEETHASLPLAACPGPYWVVGEGFMPSP
jgi:hypothetical protein